MAKSSCNLGDRIFFTFDWSDGTAYIGELAGRQTHLVELTNDELCALLEYLKSPLISEVKPVEE